MATTTQIKKSYESYRSLYKRGLKKGSFDAGHVPEMLSFSEYTNAYSDVDSTIGYLRSEGHNISHSQYIMNRIHKNYTSKELSYYEYRHAYDIAKRKGYQFREDIEPANFVEFKASYAEVDAAVQARNRDGNFITHAQYLLDEDLEFRAEEANAFIKLLREHGEEVSYDEFQRDPGYYTKLLRTYYPDDQAYDMAVSTTFNVSL